MKVSFSRPLRHASVVVTLILPFIGVGLSGCENNKPATVNPIEISHDTACSLDGMTLMDYPGPKAQIQYNQGDPDFFCDTIEMFSIYLKPEQQKRVRAIFVQDMAKTDWNSPAGHWIDAKTAFYVDGSKKKGSMGATLASFSSEADASAFATQNGGKVYRFEQVTSDMVVIDGNVIKDHMKM